MAPSADLAIECSGGIEAPQQCAEITKRGGKIVVVAFYPGQVTFDLGAVVRKDISIHTSRGEGGNNVKRAVALAAQGKAPRRRPGDPSLPLEDITTAFRVVRDRDGDPVKVVIVPLASQALTPSSGAGPAGTLPSAPARRPLATGSSPMTDRFTDELWRGPRTSTTPILAHPFFAGLTDGSLEQDAFAFYVVQDAIYLRAYAQALAAVASRAPDTAGTEMLARHAAEIITVERTLHDSLAGRPRHRSRVRR